MNKELIFIAQKTIEEVLLCKELKNKIEEFYNPETAEEVNDILNRILNDLNGIASLLSQIKEV